MNVLNALLVCSLVTLVSIGPGNTASTNTLSDAEIALCKIPALSSLLSYCAFIDRECVYTPWASWTPIRFATAKESKGKRCSGRPLVYQGTRWVSIGERSQCTASLTKTEVRCKCDSCMANATRRTSDDVFLSHISINPHGSGPYTLSLLMLLIHRTGRLYV